MIKLIVGTKGTGKTKTMVAQANAAVETSKGNVVFVEKGMGVRHELSNNVRLVDTEEFDIYGFDKFTGFLSGILASNYDITHLFVDGTFKIGSKEKNYEGLANMILHLAKVAPQDTEIVFSVSCAIEDLPSSLQHFAVK
ncbi:MAG: hypothetical protein J6A26_03315 [Oscillospiraceae bacterium]|nr:hypothetical protein [Oscillospiraceae bacterium]